VVVTQSDNLAFYMLPTMELAVVVAQQFQNAGRAPRLPTAPSPQVGLLPTLGDHGSLGTALSGHAPPTSIMVLEARNAAVPVDG
jgi:hypothetical protein